MDQLEADLEIVHAQWERAFSKATTYQDGLLPLARAMLETTVSDYSVDKADFSSLYDAEVAVLELERSLLMATAETLIRQTQTQALVGSELTGDSP
jgi:hypothetical protein